MITMTTFARVAAATLLALACTQALGQSSPGFSYGQVPTAGQWNAAFASKQDRLTFTPLNRSGDTMSGRLQTAPATVNGSGFAVLPGIAPASPANGDVWVTGAGFFVRAGGQTYTFIDSSAVAITGGTINGTAIGGTTPAPGSFTSLSATTPLPAASGGTGYSSLSAALDAYYGSTQGSVLYRGGSAWSALPPGTAGQVLTTGGAAADPSWATAASGMASILAPQGRLTLTSGTPVLTSPVSGATSVLYTPYTGTLVPLWNGSAFVMKVCAEYSQTLSDTTKSPAAAVPSSVYDIFAWDDAGTCRVTRGPAWSAGGGSNALRGSGAGSTALERVAGLYVNAFPITNGPAGAYGTYVGTIATDSGGATVSFSPGTAAAGGGAAIVGLWNAYNRVPVKGQVRDTTTSWTYGTANTWRAANNSASARLTFVVGLPEDTWEARYNAHTLGNTTSYTAIGVGLDTTTAFSGQTGYLTNQSTTLTLPSSALAQVSGQHFFSAIEFVGGGTSTFFGSAATGLQSGLIWEGRY